MTAEQFRARFSRGARGVRKRHIPGQMNRTEAAYAERLLTEMAVSRVRWFLFESVTLKLADDCRYTPDFIVQMVDGSIEFHEVKAGTKAGKPLIEDDALVKVKMAARLFPFRVVLWWQLPKSAGAEWKCRDLTGDEDAAPAAGVQP